MCGSVDNKPPDAASDVASIPRAGGFQPVGPLPPARPGGLPPSALRVPVPPTVHPSARPDRRPKAGTQKPLRACYFHNHGGCSKSDEQCSHDHIILPEADRSKMVRPAPKRSRSPPGGCDIKSPSSGGSGPSGTGGICKFFINGSCNRGDACRFTHVPDSEIARIERARAAAPSPTPTSTATSSRASTSRNLVSRPTSVGPRYFNTLFNDEE